VTFLLYHHIGRVFCKDGGYFSITVNYSISRGMLGVMCLVALLQLVRVFLLVLSVLVFSAYRLCVFMCAVCVIG